MTDTLAEFPPTLRDLLNAELAAGNRIVEVGHTFPAPPFGAFVMLANQVSTRARESFDDVRFFARNSSQYDGEFADRSRHYFVLEPPRPPGDAPDMDAIREAHNPPYEPDLTQQNAVRETMARFAASREMNFERWHDGTGYDLNALQELPADARKNLEHTFIPAKDWRDIEALIELDTPTARAALVEATQSSDIALRLAVLHRAPELFDEQGKSKTVVAAIESVQFGGLSQTLDAATLFHPPVVQKAMFRALLNRDGETAYHMATSLAVIHGLISSEYDWSLRPMLLKFNTTNMDERGLAFLDLYDVLKIAGDPELSSAAAIAAGLQHLRT